MLTTEAKLAVIFRRNRNGTIPNGPSWSYAYD